jgi:cytoskeletal protein RodZ
MFPWMMPPYMMQQGNQTVQDPMKMLNDFNKFLEKRERKAKLKEEETKKKNPPKPTYNLSQKIALMLLFILTAPILGKLYLITAFVVEKNLDRVINNLVK